MYCCCIQSVQTLIEGIIRDSFYTFIISICIESTDIPCANKRCRYLGIVPAVVLSLYLNSESYSFYAWFYGFCSSIVFNDGNWRLACGTFHGSGYSM